ncbi:phosphate ABC transporter permease subunit PstC [Acidithiobacillus sp. CV18-2]|uniref:Phosphate transport system permease protein n=1 Tax=Igneacidithiobacillus copahuensis TaxID=2724909 RepID=A0AAE3CKI8_9PROT|nr:phosphate ABC transporter permease subunit PstC [Igneacidithiobacillus copahuensis]MBU2753533.1 phosphate ABC transporter permease subunit PstC [Acidithiobacillus sp. CV18-3]MBU2757151.1 phosphate ABC transporter permease subunit PstC [Acidithiobacillus sp. BN09-2]MBU2776027.1 phosphate ABC transporter permease subunit PstC [Acidithiobacillus sp. CV18-2]MBU2795918.1 phosphate ABC transporter permease subunit PstC [Acidithiobacillus sp. VAN18-2]MBU2800296.1 phosphate ABC transporter permease
MKVSVFRFGLVGTASFLPLSLILLVAFLTAYSWPAIQYNGLQFLWTNDWNLGSLYGNPVSIHGQQVMPGARYGIWFLVVGTLASSFLALLFALPIAVGAAYFLVEMMPKWLSGPLALLVDLLAAIPSVVFGLWGYVLLIPLLGQTVFPWMTQHIGFIPYLGGSPGSGYGLLTTAIVLAFMIVPLISATMREGISAIEPSLKEAGLGLGLNRLEVLWNIILPKLKTTLVGVSILALGRALGETMAVVMVSGNALNYLPNNIYTPISTMAAFIVSQLESALQDPTNMAVEALAEIALVLLVLTVIVNIIARMILWGAKVRS